ncbi:MAG: hypothetical protein AAF802_09070 [Planctomycetota bacterium]
MKSNSILLLSGRWTVAAALWIICNTSYGQLDRVYTYDSTTASAGKIENISKNGVQLKVGSNTKNYVESEIRKITFQGDPRGLTVGRELALDGQYEQALDELKVLDLDSFKRNAARADAEYYRLLARAKLALAGRGDRKATIAEAINFAKNNQQSFHFYSVTRLLGDLNLASGQFDEAVKFYGFLSRAPSAESKIESRYLVGVASLEKKDMDAAKKAFGDVASVDVSSDNALRLKTLAKAGQAVVLANSDQGDEAIKVVDGLIADLDPNDIEMAARIYNAQGASYEAVNDIEGAILSYLHTHLMFSSQADAHAQALRRLVQLWPKVGRAERAAAARQELKRRYPGFAN